MRLGHGHRRSVLILWAWTVLLSGLVLFPLYVSSVNAFIPFGALALGVILYTLFHPSTRRQAEDVDLDVALDGDEGTHGGESGDGATDGVQAAPVGDAVSPVTEP